MSTDFRGETPALPQLPLRPVVSEHQNGHYPLADTSGHRELVGPDIEDVWVAKPLDLIGATQRADQGGTSLNERKRVKGVVSSAMPARKNSSTSSPR